MEIIVYYFMTVSSQEKQHNLSFVQKPDTACVNMTKTSSEHLKYHPCLFAEDKGKSSMMLLQTRRKMCKGTNYIYSTH